MSNAQDFIEQAEGLGEADLWEASGVRLTWEPERGWPDAVVMLRAMFKPGELVACGGAGRWVVHTREEWAGKFKRGVPLPALVVANPLRTALPRGTVPEAWGRDALAEVRNAVAVLEGMPQERQIRFWLGFGTQHLRAIVESGGGPLHAILRNDAGAVRERLPMLSALSPEAGNPLFAVRLAGAVRPDTGKRQRLLFAGRPLE